jgi:hypothetical protein
MSMNQATPVLNAVTVSDLGTYDGVEWFRTFVPDLGYDTYKALPKVVSYNGKSFIKMSYNTDNGSVSYKASSAFAVGA